MKGIEKDIILPLENALEIFKYDLKEKFNVQFNYEYDGYEIDWDDQDKKVKFFYRNIYDTSLISELSVVEKIVSPGEENINIESLTHFSSPNNTFNFTFIYKYKNNDIVSKDTGVRIIKENKSFDFNRFEIPSKAVKNEIINYNPSSSFPYPSNIDGFSKIQHLYNYDKSSICCETTFYTFKNYEKVFGIYEPTAFIRSGIIIYNNGDWEKWIQDCDDDFHHWVYNNDIDIDYYGNIADNENLMLARMKF